MKNESSWRGSTGRTLALVVGLVVACSTRLFRRLEVRITGGRELPQSHCHPLTSLSLGMRPC